MPNTVLTNAQWQVVTIQALDRFGSPAPVTNLQVSSTSPQVASIEVFGDPVNMNFKLTGVTAGFTQINVSAQNELGDTLTALLDVQVTNELAISLNILVGAPQDQ